MNKNQFIDNQQSHILNKTDNNTQSRIATEIQALQTILKFPIPWINLKRCMKRRYRQNDIQTILVSQ